MSAYMQLLDAAIRDLEGRKVGGERFAVVAPETLSALAAPAPRSHRRVATDPPAPAPRAGGFQPPPVVQARPFSPPAPAPVAAALIPPTDKAAALAALRTRALACVKCPQLVATRKHVVFGVGDIHARLMFVGEAPGVDEDRLGEPFVGAAGQLLTRIIQATGLSRDTVYIANVLKCRPHTPPGAFGNRKPSPDEMGTCLPYLIEQIQLIQPCVIVALGGTAVEGLFGISDAHITRRRGQWMDLRGTPVMPTFHPSYVLRAEDGPEKGRATKRQVWEDMLQVMERLAMPISEKQRGFFLKAG